MADATFAGPLAGSIVTPSAQKMTTAGSYLDFNVAGGWAQQYMPELYEAEVERYGNRSIGSFLRTIGAEEAMASDQVIWSEQGRLHLAYQGKVNTATGQVTAIKGIDSGATEAHAVRKGATVVCQIKTGSDYKVVKAYCTAGIETATNALTLRPYGAEHFDDLANIAVDNTADNIKFFVYGSDFGKGTANITESVEPNFKTFDNSPVIIKDHFEISGSDTAQIGWVEVSGENGQNGYLWYIKSEGDTRKRFDDYLEMVMMEAEKSHANAAADIPAGSEGLFAAIKARGIEATNQFDATADTLTDFDLLLKELDAQGAIEENAMFLGRDASINIDGMLADISVGQQGGTAYGLFNNSEDMALNLGFTGFRRGSYDFYKTDWKYLNDASTRGLVNNAATVGGVEGVLVPAGTTSVYDQSMGRNMKRPFLHVRYRASEADNRKLKSWVTGSVGAATTGDDKMEVHYLSERCLVVQGANNFVLFNS